MVGLNRPIINRPVRPMSILPLNQRALSNAVTKCYCDKGKSTPSHDQSPSLISVNTSARSTYALHGYQIVSMPSSTRPSMINRPVRSLPILPLDQCALSIVGTKFYCFNGRSKPSHGQSSGPTSVNGLPINQRALSIVIKFYPYNGKPNHTAVNCDQQYPTLRLAVGIVAVCIAFRAWRNSMQVDDGRKGLQSFSRKKNERRVP